MRPVSQNDDAERDDEEEAMLLLLACVGVPVYNESREQS
jgi:hypothetical protein